jgi:hypothetical protein
VIGWAIAIFYWAALIANVAMAIGGWLALRRWRRINMMLLAICTDAYRQPSLTIAIMQAKLDEMKARHARSDADG